MLASFLLPTRRRVSRLKESLESLEANCTEKGCYEVIIRADEDDTETIEYVRSTSHKLIVGPRGRGYLDLHRFVNECAKNSTGEFLILWNDDAQIQTAGWDSVLKEASVDPPQVYFPGGGSSSRNWFPIVRRAVYETMGRFSESALNDFYMSTVARKGWN